MSLQFRRHRRHGFDPWVRKVPWSRKWQPWEIPWTEEPCELQSMKLQRVWHEYIYHRLPWCLSSKESTCNAEDLWVGMILWRRKCQPTPVFLPGKSRGQWRLVGYGPWGCKTSDMTEWPNNNKYIPRLLYPFVCWWHLGGFHILVSVYSVALKTGVPVSFFFLMHSYFWLCSVFVASCRLSLIAENGVHPLVEVPRLLTVVASLLAEHRLQSVGSVIVVHRLNCPAACGIFPN